MRSSGGVGDGHAGVFVFFDFERMRPAFFHRVAQAMQRSHAGIAAPGKLQLGGAAGADHLIVKHVRRHADQLQVTALLADDFVARRIGNQVREAFEGDGIAILDKLLDRFF